MTDVSVAPAEVKSLDKIELKIGQFAESVVVEAGTAAVQTATSSRMGTVTAEQLTNIQMKGRDIWGMLAVIPGVQDTNMNRSFTTWTSMESHHHQRLAQHVEGRRHRRRERHRRARHPGSGEPQHRCRRRGAGHLERLHGGERPEQRRVDHHDDQVGHEPLQGVDLVQRPSQGMAGERVLPR